MSWVLDAAHALFDMLVLSGIALLFARGLFALAARMFISHKCALCAGRLLFVASFAAPVGARFMPLDPWFAPRVEVWRDTERVTAFSGSYSMTFRERPAVQEDATALASLLKMPAAFAALLALGVTAAWQLRKQRRIEAELHAHLQDMPRLRRVGNVDVRVGPDRLGAFSCIVKRRGVVVVPNALLLEPAGLKLALWHELQHLRARDPHWCRAIDMVTRLAPWHPLLPYWNRLFRREQELACDEALLGQPRFHVHDYGRLLFTVAHLASAPSNAGVWPTVAMGQECGLTLTWRVRMLFSKQCSKKKSDTWGWISLCLAVATLGTFATVSTMAMADSRLQLEEARALSAELSSNGTFPVEVNESVLKWLNHYLGTPGGRKYLRGSLKRMEQFEAEIRRRLVEAKMPEEFVYVPLLESGYKNFTWGAPDTGGGGLWGFIPSTARRYGMQVDFENGIDERLDVDKETSAAISYLKYTQSEFHDWRLALKAYNQGEGSVRKQITEHGTTDPWELERLTPSKEHYLPKFVALVLICRSPALLAKVR